MYIPDLAPYDFDLPEPLPGVVAVGWLSSSFPITMGLAGGSLVERLDKLIVRGSVNQMRGTHDCEFCNPGDTWLVVDGRRILLGAAEIWVPDPLSLNIFAAPNLIRHYVVAHSYLPPKQFVAAVEAFDFAGSWSGQHAFEDATARFWKSRSG